MVLVFESTQYGLDLSSAPSRSVWGNLFGYICFCLKVVENGYEFFADRRLVTIFSAPDYCGEFDNAGALMLIDQNLVCSFTVLYNYSN